MKIENISSAHLYFFPFQKLKEQMISCSTSHICTSDSSTWKVKNNFSALRYKTSNMELHVPCQHTNWTFKWSVRGYSSQIFRTDYFSKHQVMDLEHNIFLTSILISFLQKNRSYSPRSEPKSLHITSNTIVSCHCFFYEVCCSIRFLAVFS